MESTLPIIVGVSLLLLLLAVGMPVSFALIVAGLVPLLLVQGPKALTVMAPLFLHKGMYYGLLCVPMFIFLAGMLGASGAISDLFTVMSKWLNRVPGALACSAVAAAAIAGAAIGSSTANTAAIGTIAVPEMLGRHYDKRLTTGSIAAGATLAIMIPPSGLMVLYCIITEQSIGHQFIAGIIPGIILAIIFMIYIVVRCKLQPELAPSLGAVSWRERFASLRLTWGVAIVIFFVLVTIYTGVATATEAAALGVCAAMAVTAIRRRFTWANLQHAMLGTVRISTFVFFIIVGALIYAYFLSLLRVPQSLAEVAVASGIPGWGVIGIMCGILLIMGMFMDTAAIMMITVPIFFPIILSFGYDPIWFGIIFIITMEWALITPPVGFNLFVLKGIVPPEVTFGDISMGAAPFVLLLGIGIILVMLFPELALWLPSTMG